MSTKHTPGPWFRDDRSGLECDVRASSERKIALCWGLASNNATNYNPKYRAECDANARRIVACVNACEGISADELEEIASTGGMLGPREDVARIAKQRDALLEALEELVAEFGVCGLTEKARSAIAKATGEQP